MASTNKEDNSPVEKKLKLAEPSASSTTTQSQPAFNGVANSNNDVDLSLKQRGNLPLLPKDCRILLLDIEGCTTSISFVKDVLFPYVLEHIGDFLKSLDDEAVTKHRDALKADLPKITDESVREACSASFADDAVEDLRLSVQKTVEAMVSHDVKATGLKALQGQMWKAGYASGELKGHVYEDFLPLLQWCQSQKVDVHIYSSGSIGAQKLLFGSSTKGDLTTYLTQHFDTTSGGKKEAASYKTIAASLKVEPSQICFVSDAEAELVAAREAGVGFVVMSVRPGNASMTEVGYAFPRIYSLLQLCGC